MEKKSGKNLKLDPNSESNLTCFTKVFVCLMTSWNRGTMTFLAELVQCLPFVLTSFIPLTETYFFFLNKLLIRIYPMLNLWIHNRLSHSVIAREIKLNPWVLQHFISRHLQILWNANDVCLWGKWAIGKRSHQAIHESRKRLQSPQLSFHEKLWMNFSTP